MRAHAEIEPGVEGPPAESTPRIKSRTQRDMVEAFGRLGQVLGLPRSVGQIYGLLYLSPTALSLDDMVELLGMSKASASTGSRQLIGWGALKQVWVPGDRRDYFEAVGDFGSVLRAAYASYFKSRLESSRHRLEAMQEFLEEDFRGGAISEAEYKFCLDRLRQLVRVQKKAQTLAPLIERLM